MSDRPWYPGRYIGADHPYSLAECIASVGPGWHVLAEHAWRLCDAQRADIYQLKEKFGQLFVHTGRRDAIPSVRRAASVFDARTGLSSRVTGNWVQLTDAELGTALERIERLSLTICERCGAPGESVLRMWKYRVKTLCKEHQADFLNGTDELEWDPCHSSHPRALKPIHGSRPRCSL